MSHSDSTSDPDINVLSTALLKLLQRDQSTDPDKQESLSQEISARLHSWSMGHKVDDGVVYIAVGQSSISKELRSERDTLLLTAVRAMQGDVRVIVQVPPECSSGPEPGLPVGQLLHDFSAGSFQGTALLVEGQVKFKISDRQTRIELGVIPFPVLRGLHGPLGELRSDGEPPGFSIGFDVELWTEGVPALSVERMAKITDEIQRLCQTSTPEEDFRGLSESRDLRAASALCLKLMREGLRNAEQMTEISSDTPVLEEPLRLPNCEIFGEIFKSSSDPQDNTWVVLPSVKKCDHSSTANN